jgi:hypothetical protein
MSVKYLLYFPKPVLDDLVVGKWLPVIGAGMSLNAVVPKCTSIASAAVR